MEFQPNPQGEGQDRPQTDKFYRFAEALADLQRAAMSLSVGDSPDGLLDKILGQVCNVLDVEAAAVFLPSSDASIEIIAWDSAASAGREAKRHRLPPGHEAVRELVSIEKPARFDHPSVELQVSPRPVRALLCAPLAHEGRSQGSLAVMNKCKGDFEKLDEELLVIIAGLLAQALHSQRAIQEMNEDAARLSASHAEMTRSRNTLRSLFDSMPAGLYIIDRDYSLVAINMSCASRIGKKPHTLVGGPCYTALYGRQTPCPGCLVGETIFNGQSTSRTERRWGEQEDASEWEISTYPIFDEAGEVSHAILLEEDVTEKRRLESILAQSEKLAALGQLAAGVAHEINNPLTAIIANAQLLQRELAPDDEMQESVDLIARAGARATQVVRNLLDFARKEQYPLSLIDVNETIQRSLALVQHELQGRSIRLVFTPDPALPPIHASQDHLQGLWLNLVMNALDAIEHDHGELHVSTHAAPGEIRAVIADNGKGIPPERLRRIFEPFYTTKAPGRGTGLGLSVCERVVKQHGGQILVESQVGVGTSFTVVLPIF